MKKNLLQPEVRTAILARIDKITPNHTRQWGTMDVLQGLRHMNEGIKIGLGETKTAPRPGSKLQKSLMRFFILKTDFPTPKAKAETFKEINMVANKIYPTDLKAEKDSLKQTIERFVAATKLEPKSELIGPMTKEEWARLNYTHMDHHLKQFGA